MVRDEIFFRTASCAVDKIYDSLAIIDKLLLKSSIRYSIVGGTLLGAIRHGGLIPWDDDGDIIISEEDEYKFILLQKEFLRHGFIMASWWGGYKISPIDGQKWEGNAIGSANFPAIDILPITSKKPPFVFSRLHAAEKWKTQYFTRDDWDSLSKIDFGHLKLFGLSKHNAKRYLDDAFGPNWNSIAYQIWNHETDQPHKKQEVEITDFSYARHSLHQYKAKGH